MANDTQAKTETKDVVSPNANGVATKEFSCKLNEMTTTKLLALVKYANKEQIALFGTVAVEKELGRLSTEFISEMIASRYKQQENQLKDRANKKTSEYFRLLVSKGVPVDQAYKLAYGQ